MAKQRWEPGTVIRTTNADGDTYYGRLLEFPWAAFYDLRTEQPLDDLQAIVAAPVAFTVAAHKDLIAKNQWEAIGSVALDGSLQPPAEQAMIDVLDPDHHQIIDAEGNIRDATAAEVAGLEPAAVWDPEHVVDRLDDHFAGRPNRWLQGMLPPQ
jgi:hypothetical protein